VGEQPEKGLALFQEGRALYLAQKWDVAIRVFREASGILAPEAPDGDGPCQVFIERCEEFGRTRPGNDWDGAWVMTSK
jgi:adenylate cyclase